MKIIMNTEELFEPFDSHVIYPKLRIDARVRGMGVQIDADYADKDLVIICVLASGLVFTADLMRAIKRPLDLGFMRATSYSKSGERIPVVVEDFLPDRVAVTDRDVLIVDGISESGKTFAEIRSLLEQKEDGPPKSIKTCVFAQKRNPEYSYTTNYCGIVIPNCLVYGYGINHIGKRRNEPNLNKMSQQELNNQVITTTSHDNTLDTRVSPPPTSKKLTGLGSEERVEQFDQLISQVSKEWKDLKKSLVSDPG